MKRIHSNHSNIHIKIVLFEVDNEKFENEVSSRLIYILLSCNICICQINVWFNNYWCLLFWYDYVLFLNSLHSLIQQSISSWHIKWWMRWFTRRYGDVSTINFVDISRRFSMEYIKRCEMGDKWNNEIHN